MSIKAPVASYIIFKSVSQELHFMLDCKKDVSETNRRTQYVEIVAGVQFISVWWVLTMP